MDPERFPTQLGSVPRRQVALRATEAQRKGGGRPLNTALFGHEDLQVNWYKGLNIDHLVPKGIGVSFDLIKILEDRSNKQLLHRHCHQTKYALDNKFIYKFKSDFTNALKRSQYLTSSDTAKL